MPACERAVDKRGARAHIVDAAGASARASSPATQAMQATQFEPPFVVREPDWQSLPFVFSAPHSGRVYPASFLDASRLDALTLRRSEDAYVDDLFAAMPTLGAPLVAARFPRAYLDVNREPYELDPRLFEERPPAYANTRSLRVAGGLGTVPRVVGDGQEIYARRLPLAEGLARIEHLHRPYHRALRRMLGTTVQDFGFAVLVDCHSMPSSGLPRDAGRPPDIILGDRFGTSCGGGIVDAIEHAFRAAGLHVTRNRPYAGGYITEHYGEPLAGRHALQIEIARALYMNERTLEPNAGFEPLRRTIPIVMTQAAAALGHDPQAPRLAAE